jgi:methyl-accepting chemotaxis protein
MKNLSVSKKLVVGFGSVLALMLLSILLSVFSISTISKQVYLYGKNTVPNGEHVRSMQVKLQGILFTIADTLLTEDSRSIQTHIADVDTYAKDIRTAFDAYKSNQLNQDKDADFEIISGLLNEAADIRNKIIELVQGSAPDKKQAVSLFQSEYKPKIQELMDILVSFSTAAKSNADIQYADTRATAMRAWVILAIFALTSILLSVALVILISRSVLLPVREIMGAFQEMSQGNLKANVSYTSNDELGHVADYIRQSNQLQSDVLHDVLEKLSWIAQGNLRFQVTMDYPRDFHLLKETIIATAEAINKTMYNIRTAAEQVSAGSNQVAYGAQALAAGSTEQAATVQELNATAVDVARQAQANLAQVQRTTEQLHQTAQRLTTGNDYMGQLTEAMDEIGAASEQIASITKVIEDIAFQTNILALNAAIEAARAGAAGKGFAVVADEVRNLAAKSAEAARQTGELISNSVTRVERGSHLASETARILEQVVEETGLVVEGLSAIEQVSDQQTHAIEQVREGLDQVSSVVQTNAATAEENSATSEEMSAQADTLRSEVEKFQLTDTEDISSFSASQPLPTRIPVTVAAGASKY